MQGTPLADLRVILDDTAGSDAAAGPDPHSPADHCQRTDIDVVCIATPDRLHAPQSIDALNAGKDVYCEKPLTHWDQFELAKEVEKAAVKNSRLVQVGTQYMADENLPVVRKMIEDGVIGKPVQVDHVDYILNNSFGMLGINSCLIIKRFTE